VGCVNKNLFFALQLGGWRAGLVDAFVYAKIIFKLEAEEKLALLLLLPKLFAETAVLDSALETGCWLVVAFP
jgi:hypothetical protein